MRRRQSPTHPYQDDSRGPRIQKVLADAGVGSRRACEEAVDEGRVTVNGHRIDGLPAWVDPAKDDIRFDGRRLKAAERHVYVMLFKPKGYVSTNSDPEGRPRAIDIVRHPSHARLYAVGRLDLDASGLLLLTNDGELANRLTHPRFEMAKGYEVMVGGRVEDSDVQRLERAVFRSPAGEGESASGGSHLVVLKRDAARSLLYMELRESRNRDVRTLMARLGHPVRKLRRVRMGPLQLKGLQAGEWRELTPKELAILREHAFATPQQRAARKSERRPSPAAVEEAKVAERAAQAAAKRAPSRGGRTSGARTTSARTPSSRTPSSRTASPRTPSSRTPSPRTPSSRTPSSRTPSARSGASRSRTGDSGPRGYHSKSTTARTAPAGRAPRKR